MDFPKIFFLTFLFYASAFAGSERLPNDVTPSHYKIELTLGKSFVSRKIFKGSVEINIAVKEETSEIILHSYRIDYTEATITLINPNSDDVKYIVIPSFHLVPYEQLLLEIRPKLPPGDYVLKFENFEAVLYDDMFGFYLSSYKTKAGQKEYVASTQFQPTYARRAFPCFDEPHFKATFTVIIHRPEEYISLSNTQSTTDGTTDTYEKTPLMSTYLVAFVVSKFKGYRYSDAANRVQFDVWCREEALETAEFAYETGITMIEEFDKLFGIPYYENGINKMDLVAIPDFAAGAMENWGLVTYRETSLLWDEKHSTVNYLQRVGTVMAHELAHMWFGNMVTLKWWKHTWLNEGFSSYYQYFLADKVFPEWELDKQFVIEELQLSLVHDAVVGDEELNAYVLTPTEIRTKFGVISYNKGASIIRMMKNFLGETAYHSGIVDYLTVNKYKNTEPRDLYKSLSKFKPETLPFSIEAIMRSWTDQEGYPVVTVSRNASGLVLKQKRFLVDPKSNSYSTWYIPITYTTEAEADFSDPTVKVWMKQGETEILIEEGHHDNSSIGDDVEKGWVLVNVLETGYYRVNYADELWDKLDEALKSGKTNFSDVNKAQIVDDAMNLARANKLSYGKALDVTSFLRNDTSYYPWYAAFNAFSFLRKRIDSSGKTGKYLEEHISNLMKNLYESVSFERVEYDLIETLKTSLTLQWACRLGNEDCIKQANEKFAIYALGQNIEPNIRSTVYCSAVREDNTNKNWNILWKKFEESDLATEKITILKALGCSKDKETLKKYLRLSIIEGSGIRKQDASVVFTAVLDGNPENINTAFEFLIENINFISSYYEGMNALSNVILGIADRIVTEEQISKFGEFLESNVEYLKDAAHMTRSALATAEANVGWAKAKEHELFNWLDGTYGSAASTILSLTLFIVTISTLLFIYR